MESIQYAKKRILQCTFQWLFVTFDIDVVFKRVERL